MSRVTTGLLLLAVAVPVTAYVAGSVAGTDAPLPTDHSPVILRDATDRPAPGDGTDPTRQRRDQPDDTRDDTRDDKREDPPDRPVEQRDQARVVTPHLTPVGEDDDDEWDDDGPGDDDTETDDGDD